MLDNLRVDIQQAHKANAGRGDWLGYVKVFLQLGTLAVVSHRFCHWAMTRRISAVRWVFWVPAVAVKATSQLLTGVHISPRAQIGPGLVVHTVYGIFIPPVRIGANFVVQTGVLLGYGTKMIGDNVCLGAGVKVIENTTIGSNVVVMPNSLVITDVPDNVTVVGVPARIRLPRVRPIWFSHGPSRNNSSEDKKGAESVVGRPTSAETGKASPGG